MSYYFSKDVALSWEDAIERVTAVLASKGFGVLTRIDVAATLKKKLDVDFRPYVILGACNPKFAYRALGEEPNIGAMLPCNVVVQRQDDGSVNVSAVDPVASMQAIANPGLGEVAGQVRRLLREVIDEL
jgi:uncharacterized protein (DUF302 family)